MHSREHLAALTRTSGLKNTDQEVIEKMRNGDGLLIGLLVGDQAKIYAVGRL